MSWEQDKIKHYKCCYDLTNKAPKLLKPLWGLGILLGATIFKEVINDKILGRGTPDWGDVVANYEGCKDAIINKQSRF